MKKLSFLDSIEVRTPCSQDWDSMRGNEEMRFCDHCVKHVHDLSALTRKDARKLIARSNGGICVRYIRRPDGRIETLKHRLHQLTRRTGIAAGVLGTSLTVSTLSYAQTTETDPAPENRTAVSLAVKENGAANGMISGVIIDQNGAVIPFAVVTVFNEAAAFYRSAPTNADGYYEFRDLPEGNYKLKVDASGFESKELSEILITAAGVSQAVQLSVAQMEVKVEVDRVDFNGTASVTVGLISCTTEVANGTKNKLILAVQGEDVEEVKRLIGLGKKINVKNTFDDGNFPLHYAVENGNLEIVQLLLNAGAKVSVKNYDKKTPLMMLDYDASPDLVNILLRFGAAVNAVDKDKDTPLMIAAGDASEAVLRVLILNGADVNAFNKEGKTALMRAAGAGSLENVKALLESGADANIQDKEGETALSAASAQEIKQLLVSFGAMAREP